MFTRFLQMALKLWQGLSKFWVGQQHFLVASKEMGTESYCYSWGEEPHQAWTESTYWLPSHSRDDQFAWRWGEEEKKEGLKAYLDSDDKYLNNEGAALLSKFKKIHRKEARKWSACQRRRGNFWQGQEERVECYLVSTLCKCKPNWLWWRVIITCIFFGTLVRTPS